MNRDSAVETGELHGIGVSPGIAIGKARLVEKTRVKILYQYLLRDEQLQQEVQRFQEALHTTEEQLQALKDRIPPHVKAHVFILNSLLMILQDSTLTDSTIDRIRKEKINAEWALKKSLEEIRELFGQIDDQYISARIDDVEDVTDRILRNLAGQRQESLSEIDERIIIVARNISPTDIPDLDTSKIMSFITDLGGRTSHAAIMAQALRIPVVVGLESATARVREGDLLIVDGTAGEVVINPDDQAIIAYQEKQLQYEAYDSDIARTSHLPAKTLDGHRISVGANIEFLEEAPAAKEHGAEGIGLYRTEFLYLKSKGLPEEDELFEDYKKTAELMAPDPVTIRTLDLGGDKFVFENGAPSEVNPALGLRAIRYSLQKPDIFKTQLRAILRAGNFGRVQLLVPMISGLQEILQAKTILAQVKEELQRENLAYDSDIPIGIMIEVPSAVIMADFLAEQVDFFSVGTNDLIQYALAVDRINENLAYMYQPYDPAILRMIRQVVAAGQKAGIEVSVCGEMAGDPLCVPILLGLGVEKLSTNPRSVPLVKNVIQNISLEDVRNDFQKVLGLSTAEEVHAYILKQMKVTVPALQKWGYLA